MANIIGKWQIVPDGAGCFEIFDQDKGVFLHTREYPWQFHREIDAEAWIQNHQEQIEGSVETMEEKRYTLMNDFGGWDIWDVGGGSNVHHESEMSAIIMSALYTDI